MAITTIITSRGTGGLTFTRNGVAFQLLSHTLKYQGYPGKVSFWAEEREGLVSNRNFPALGVPVAEIEVNGVSGYTTSTEVCQAIDILILQGREMGVCNGEYTPTLSDSEDLARPGWMTPITSDGTIKYTTVKGDVCTRSFLKDQTSLVRVKRIWSTGTTSGMGIIIND